MLLFHVISSSTEHFACVRFICSIINMQYSNIGRPVAGEVLRTSDLFRFKQIKQTNRKNKYASRH